MTTPFSGTATMEVDFQIRKRRTPVRLKRQNCTIVTTAVCY
jgi:hypothetical protein